MAKITDPSKLLPSAKVSSSIVRVGRSSIVPSVKFSTKSIALSTEVLRRKRVQETSDVNGQLVRIGNFFKIDLENSKKESEKKRKEKEKEDFSEAEKKLETPKVKGFKFPKMNFPAMGLLERIKKFLFFTAVGWLLPKLIELIPKLEGVLKLITGTYLFVEDIFNRLLDGFSTLVKFGGDLKNNAIGFLAKTKGGNYQKEFDKLESQFNNFVNLSIVAGLLGTDIGLAAVDEYNKWRKKNQEVARGKFGTGAAAYLLKDAGRELGERKAGYQDPGRYRAKGQARAGGFALEQARKKLPQPKPPSWWNRIFKGPLSKLKKPFSRFLGVAIPGAGAAFGAINAKIRFDSGDKLGGTLASISAALDAGTALAALTGIGLPVAGVLGTISMGIDVLLLIRDVLRIFRVPDKILGFSNGGRVVRKYQGGGNTRQSRSPRRSFTPAKRKPFKISPQRSQPGKDVGGKKEIEILYPDTKKKLTVQEWIKGNYAGTYDDYKRHYERNTNQPNSYKALTFASQSFKDLPAGLGHIVGAAIDSTLGQKVDVKRAIQQFSYGMAYLAENYANQRVNMSMSSLARDVNVFADGGYVPPSREMRRTNEMANFGEMLSRVLEPAINLKINEVIQSVRKEINKKGKKDDTQDGNIPSDQMLDGEEYTYNVTGGELPSKYPGRGPRTGHNYPARDYQIEVGRAITVFVPGTVTRAGMYDPSGYGNEVIIRHENGLLSQYAHLSKILVKEGDMINEGKVIGLTGGQPGARGAGRTTGPHLHFEVRDSTNRKITQENSGDNFFRFGTVTRVQRRERMPDNLRETGKIFTGSASWYGRKDGFQGKPTSNGEIFDTDKLTAAIQINLRDEFGGVSSGKRVYYAKVTNTENNKSVVVRINDVGPLVPGGVIDLSEAAFKRIASGGLGQGRIPNVTVEKLTTTSPIQSSRYQQPSRQGEQLKFKTKGELGEAIRKLKPGETLGVPGVGKVVATNRKPSRLYYLNGNPDAVPYDKFIVQFERTRSEYSRETNQRPQQPQIGPRTSSGFSAAPSGATGVQFYTNPEGNKLTYYILRGHDGPKYYAIVDGESLSVGRDRYEEVVKLIRKRNRSTNPFSNLMRIITGGKQKGGLIAPSTSRLPIPNSFASYEHPDSRMMIAIQPIIIEKTVPTSSSTNSPITFPVLVGVNNNNLDSYRG